MSAFERSARRLEDLSDMAVFRPEHQIRANITFFEPI
jgi:hypothetical protein